MNSNLEPTYLPLFLPRRTPSWEVEPNVLPVSVSAQCCHLQAKKLNSMATDVEGPWQQELKTGVWDFLLIKSDFWARIWYSIIFWHCFVCTSTFILIILIICNWYRKWTYVYTHTYSVSWIFIYLSICVVSLDQHHMKYKIHCKVWSFQPLTDFNSQQ